MNQTQITGKWKEIKGEIRKAWGELTDDQLEQTKGNMESISGLIQQKFGLSKEQASEKLNTVYGKFDSVVEAAKDKLRESNERDSKKQINKYQIKVHLELVENDSFCFQLAFFIEAVCSKTALT